ncbi:hypothetical protein BD779DRAFT_1540503, partial [Infundibulicybe gibba]
QEEQRYPGIFPILMGCQKLDGGTEGSHQLEYSPTDPPAGPKPQTGNSKPGLAAKLRSNVHHMLHTMHPTGSGKTLTERPALAISTPMPLRPRKQSNHVGDHDRHTSPSPKAENPVLVVLRDGNGLGTRNRPRAESMKLGREQRGDTHSGILKRPRVQSTKSCHRVRFQEKT